MTLFDLQPKGNPDDLFGRDQELEQLRRLIEARRWAVVLGARMVGKTSLVRAVTSQLKRPVAYVNLWGISGTVGFVEAFAASINSNRSLLSRLRTGLRSIEGISVGPAGVSVAAPRRPLKTVWDLMGLMADQEEDSVFVLDEFQEVSAATGQILKILGNLFNTYTNVEFVFTGSRSGVIRSLLEPKGSSPLLGRPPAQLQLKAFSNATAVDFLETGFKEHGKSVPRADLSSVVSRLLGGIPGWLALYGSHVAIDQMTPPSAESQTFEDAKGVLHDELHHLLEHKVRRNYWTALKKLAVGTTWSDLRRELTSERGYEANDSTVHEILKSLEASDLVAHTDSLYILADPMVRRYVLATSRIP
jgi:uncharacterized protein